MFTPYLDIKRWFSFWWPNRFVLCYVGHYNSRYRILKELGDGTCGNVYKAINTETSEIVSDRLSLCIYYVLYTHTCFSDFSHLLVNIRRRIIIIFAKCETWVGSSRLTAPKKDIDLCMFEELHV